MNLIKLYLNVIKLYTLLLCLILLQKKTDVSLSLLYHHPTIFFTVNHQHLTIKEVVLTGTKQIEENRYNCTLKHYGSHESYFKVMILNPWKVSEGSK